LFSIFQTLDEQFLLASAFMIQITTCERE